MSAQEFQNAFVFEPGIARKYAHAAETLIYGILVFDDTADIFAFLYPAQQLYELCGIVFRPDHCRDIRLHVVEKKTDE